MSSKSKFSKSERAALRELAGEAWEAELHEALGELFEEFCKWADDGISSLDLTDKIHEFHKGIAKELYGRYTNLEAEITVSRAVAFGFIDEKRLPESLHAKLADRIECFRESKND